MSEDDEPSFLRARCPLTGVRARAVTTFVIVAQRHEGAGIVLVAGAPPLDKQIVSAANNLRRAVAILCARRPANAYLQRARTAVEASKTFCVAVALSADELEARHARRRVSRN